MVTRKKQKHVISLFYIIKTQHHSTLHATFLHYASIFYSVRKCQIILKQIKGLAVLTSQTPFHLQMLMHIRSKYT